MKNLIAKKTKVLLALLVSVAVVVIYVSAVPSTIALRKVKPAQFTLNEGAVSNGGSREIKPFPDLQRPDVDIETSFVARAVDSGYPNLFQTADVNAGIRFELGTNGGLIYSTGPGTQYQITVPVKIDQVNRLHVRAVHGEYVKVVMNGVETMVTEPKPMFGVSRVRVGAGFDASRIFNGQVLDFKMTAVDYRRYQLNLIKYNGLVLALYILAMLWLKLVPTKKT